MKKNNAKLLIIIVFLLTAFFTTILANNSKIWRLGAKDANYEEEFLNSYKITEEIPETEEGFKAFGRMTGIFRFYILDNKYLDNQIKSKELNVLLKKLFENAKNPKTARDYFFRATFTYSGIREYASIFTESNAPFLHIINEFPDSIYAKYSYFYLASYYKRENKYEEATTLYKEFIDKYSNIKFIVPRVYTELATMYFSLYFMSNVSKETAEDREKINMMLEYSEKLFKEFPEQKELASRVLFRLGNYYEYMNDQDKALEYYYKNYNNNDPYPVYNIIKIYRRRKEYDKIYALLEDVKLNYFNRRSVRKVYKEEKLLLEQINRFSFEEEVLHEDATGKKYTEIMPVPNENKDAIIKFRAEYEKCFDADFNLIKPIESIKIYK